MWKQLLSKTLLSDGSNGLLGHSSDHAGCEQDDRDRDEASDQEESESVDPQSRVGPVGHFFSNEVGVVIRGRVKIAKN